MVANGANYRNTLYDRYVSVHQGTIDEARSSASLEVDIVRRVTPDRCAEILDVGCGQGQLVRLLRSHGYSAVSGIDVSGEQIALAHELGTDDVRQADVFEYARAHPAAFDNVIAIDVVEHFDRPEVAPLFETLGSMLRPGGAVILRTPNAAGPYGGRLLYSDMTHGTAYTARSLAQIGRSAGFASVRSFASRPAGRGLRQLIRRGLWAVIERIVVIPLIVETGQLRGHIVTQNLVSVLTRPR